MRNLVKWFGIIALVAIIGFTMVTCDNGNGPDTTPTVTSVTVSPKTPNVVKGNTQQFTATVAVTNGAAQTVRWSIETSGVDAGSTITNAGLLTVSATETKTSLTIKATSTADTSKSDTATVTIYNDAGSLPTVASVTVNPSTATVAKGATQSFTATVAVTNGAAQTVTWSIDQTNKNAGTTISTSGVLTVAAAESLASLTVKATSTVDATKSGTATVTISSSSDNRPASPESMSSKTALQYFTDNNIKAGWNLGNTLDAVNAPSTAVETAWGNPRATQALFNGVKESGFDMVRIGCTWIGHIGSAPDYTVSEARLQRVAEVVGYAKTAGFKAVVINIHHDGNWGDGTAWGFVDFKGASGNAAKKTEIQNQIGKVWTQIAEYFKNYGDYLIFETLNEVHSGNWGSNAPNNEQDILFDWNQAALSAIRATGGNNATRYVAVPGLGSTEPGTVISAHARGKLLPNDGANGTGKLIVSVHFYDPWRYTVADATGQGDGVLLHTWGTSAEKEHLAHEIGSLKTTFINNNIAVYIGEWGAPTDIRSSMSTTIKNTHLDYMGSVAAAARSNGIVPILWDDGGNFKCLERSNGKPKAGLWKDVLDKIMSSINSTTPPVIGGGDNGGGGDIEGNLGNYRFGLQEDGVTVNNQQAVWELSEELVTTAQTAGAKLVLVLSAAPSATMQLVWQGPDNNLWWQGQIDILGETGTVNGGTGAEWNAGTKTLTITLSTAFAASYSTFTAQSSLNLVVAYYGGASVNDLRIVSANLE